MPNAQVQDDSTLAALREQAATGVPEAVYKLATALVVRGEVDEAFALHGIAADAGHAGSQVEYARMLLYGVGVDADPHLAVEWLLRAEGIGNPIASYYLALVALGSVVLPRDGRINERMLVAVQHDYPPALRAAAIHFGRKPHPDAQTLCLKLLDRGAGRGDPVAAQLLAERLQRGEGCPGQAHAAAELRRQMSRHGVAALPSIVARKPQQPLRGQVDVDAEMLAFEEALTPARATPLAEHPRVARIDGLLSSDECRLLVASALPGLRRSQTVDPDSGLGVQRELRTSSDASLDPVAEDFALRLVQLRMARAARVELPQAEHLVVLRYEPGQEYRPHRDYRPSGSLERDRPQAGNRLRTICVYLNEVEAGGETAFPVARLKVAPEAGRAVVFDNLHTDGTPDVDSLHAGLPVLRGEKWLATLWLREQRYRDY